MSFSLESGGDLTMLVQNERGQRMINSVGEWFAESDKSLNNIFQWSCSARWSQISELEAITSNTVGYLLCS